MPVRPLPRAERAAVEDSVRAPDAFVLRRAQIVVARAAGARGGQLAPRVGFRGHAVRDVIQACNRRGLAILTPGSPHPGVVASACDTPRAVALRALLHQRPRMFGKPRSLWTLERAAAVASEPGRPARRVSAATIRAPLARVGVRWRRAKAWISRPARAYARKTARRDPQTGCAAARTRSGGVGWPSPRCTSGRRTTGPCTWSSRRARATIPIQKPWPVRASWRALGPRRRAELWLRFVAGRPVSAAPAQERGKHAVLLVGDTASWHDSQIVRSGVRAPKRQVKQAGPGVRRSVCDLPSKSPWLTPIEPKWLHGKRKGRAPDRLLASAARAARVCAVYGCPPEPHLIPPRKAPSTSQKAA